MRLDPEQGGIGDFEAFLESDDRDALIAEHFQFLGMKLVTVGTFGANYNACFQSDGVSVEVFNDDPDAYPEYGTGEDWDFVVFSFSGPDAGRVQANVRRLTECFDGLVIPYRSIDPT